MLVQDGCEKIPTWRGWIHAATFPVAIALGAVLLIFANGDSATASALVFVASSVLLFGTSALYHRINWCPRMRLLFKRIDHSNIFLLIGGTYTPIAVLALPPEKAVPVLWFVWCGALLGIAFRILWIDVPRWLSVLLYLLLSWVSLIFVLDLFAAHRLMMTLLLIGGACYTCGAVIYGLKRPDPLPGVFGHHEIFHSLTLVAFLCHWTGIFLIALKPTIG